MTRILVLRPQPGADATVAKARERGLDAVALPVFAVHPVAWEVPEPGGFDGLLLTSANAVRYGGEGLKDLRGLKVYAVGDATAQAARTAGFDIAASGESGVDRLLGSIHSDLKLLHLCGADRRKPDKPQQRITPIIVYRTVEVKPPGVLEAQQAVALVHSPRAGSRLAELVRNRSSIRVAAISEPAAEAAGDGWRQVAVSPQPTDDALLALAASLCDKPDPE